MWSGRVRGRNLERDEKAQEEKKRLHQHNSSTPYRHQLTNLLVTHHCHRHHYSIIVIIIVCFSRYFFSLHQRPGVYSISSVISITPPNNTPVRQQKACQGQGREGNGGKGRTGRIFFDSGNYHNRALYFLFVQSLLVVAIGYSSSLLNLFQWTDLEWNRGGEFCVRARRG